jgi:hypothetical protein
MRTLAVGMVCALAAGGSACSQSAPAGTAQAVATPSAQSAPTPGAQPAASPTPTPLRTATPVDFETLIAALPEPPIGWTRSKPKGEQISAGAAQSLAEADYDKGDSTIHLEIRDTAFEPLQLTPLDFALAPTYSERTAGGYRKASPVSGSPGFESWEADSNTAELTVVVGGRIIVFAKGRGVDDVRPVRTLVSAVDQDRLRTIK